MNDQSQPSRPDDALLLAADVGGTKTVLALYRADGGPQHPVAKATFSSTQHASLEDVVAAFLKDRNVSIRRASFGIAGPVVDGRVQVTNLPWVVEEQSLGGLLGAPVRLLNDLAAIAYAVPRLGRGRSGDAQCGDACAASADSGDRPRHRAGRSVFIVDRWRVSALCL